MPDARIFSFGWDVRRTRDTIQLEYMQNRSDNFDHGCKK